MSYVTGKTIKELREKRKMTQRELAEKINVSDKTISKWETDKGLPDIGIVEESDEKHCLKIETIENEYHVSMDHPMDKKHYVSFLAYVTSDTCEIVKLYPEQEISARFRKKGHGVFYAYCNRHGLFKTTI